VSVDNEQDEIIKEFLIESHENLDLLDRGFVSLERNPKDLSVIGSIFRTIHTIKGTAGFLGFGKLESLTHAGESLLSMLRDGELLLSSDIASALLAMVDAVRKMLATIEAARSEGEDDYAALIAALHALQTPGAQAPSAPTPERAAAPPPPPPPPAAVAAAVHEPAPLAAAPSADAVAFGGTALAPQEHAAEATVSALADNTIRVDVRLLDRLMNLVGELVLARNQVLQFTARSEEAALTATSQRLNLITTELQEGVMKTRMQPIGNVWSKLPRVVRDVATACSKRVDIEMEGQDTELDRTIIEAIKDPLTHIVRNAIDHGIETPGERSRKGKPATGRLSLRAFHEGGQVNIEIADDGAGIELERVKNKAIQRGLISVEQADRMDERDLTNLIFLPGFSTAEKVSNISGRGVGMDVVRTNIEKIGGTVDIRTRPGAGTVLQIKIPLTLAIIPALIVGSGGDRYAIPQVNLVELVLLEGEQARRRIETVQGAPVYRLRGQLLPIVYLHELFRQGEPERGGAPGDEPAAVNIVVLKAGDQQFGLVVASINDTEEIVVKPLDKQLKGVPTFAGATIMGDGKVALILDVPGIAQYAGLISGAKERSHVNQAADSGARKREQQTLLLCGVGRDGRLAIPLEAVDRLEEFPRTAVEPAGDQMVIQYRGDILPLLWLANLLPGTRQHLGEVNGSLQVVVYRDGPRTLGLVVDRILDIVEENPTIERPAARPGILGSAVVQGRVTEVLDVGGGVSAIEPTLSSAPPNWLNVA
jgi:two-component system, chemotaxis family, sensor kinase CheA